MTRMKNIFRNSFDFWTFYSSCPVYIWNWGIYLVSSALYFFKNLKKQKCKWHSRSVSFYEPAHNHLIVTLYCKKNKPFFIIQFAVCVSTIPQSRFGYLLASTSHRSFKNTYFNHTWTQRDCHYQREQNRTE